MIFYHFSPKKKEDKHKFIHQNLHSIEALLKTEFQFELERLRQVSVYDGLEYAIRQFQLAEHSDAYLTYLMDAVLEVEQKEGTGISTFLAYWNTKKARLCITAPANINAVQIMSIHKAKGLEFTIVIYPFANSHIYKRMDKKLWIPVDSHSYYNFDELLVNEKKEVVEYGATSERLFIKEEHQMELDAFNVLYVALTRAVKALFIITEKDLTQSGEHKPEYYSGLFIHYLKEKRIWQADKTSYSFGLLEEYNGKRSEKILEHIPYQYSQKERAGFQILAKSGVLWDTGLQKARIRGNLIHAIMGLIETQKDAPLAIKTLRQKGDISSEEADYITTKVYQILEHPLLKGFYDDGLRVRNEVDILTGEGRLFRPDRIVFEGNKTTLMDYKSGKKNPKYHEQLYDYADTLISMGYAVENKIIVYIDQSITPEFI